MVQAVEQGSPAHHAGLKEGDIITHVNNESVQGMQHIQVVSLILRGGNRLSLRFVPMEGTTIKRGGRRRSNAEGKLAKQRSKKRPGRHKSGDGKRRPTLLRRLSQRRADQHHLQSPGIAPSRSFHQALQRSYSTGDNSGRAGRLNSSGSPRSPPVARLHSSGSDSANSTANSSNNSSPSSSIPNSPASSAAHFSSRPSSLHGLKHKKQPPPAASSGAASGAQTSAGKSPNRRKSVHNIPLSPLARTPSPSPMATSPTRSPSPLTLVPGHPTHVLHPPGISNKPQTYNPTQQLQTSPSPNTSLTPPVRRFYSRPRSFTEQTSPLLRRALSPDRLHPGMAEKSRSGSSLRRKASFQERNSKKNNSNAS